MYSSGFEPIARTDALESDQPVRHGQPPILPSPGRTPRGGDMLHSHGSNHDHVDLEPSPPCAHHLTLSSRDP